MTANVAVIGNTDAEPGQQLARLSDRDFDRLSRFIHDTCGINIPPGKKIMLETRLHKRLRSLGMESFADYCTYLFAGGEGQLETVRLIDLVTTNKTDFFREPDHFAYLVREVLPPWLRRRGEGHPGTFRVWSAGCASGEEPFTLAMVLQEFSAAAPGFDFTILATDISTRMLETACVAVFPEERTAPVPDQLRRKYLLRSRDRSVHLARIVPALRRKVHFHYLNLMADDFGIGEQMDIIFCRNVIIYFDRPTQQRVLQHLCRQLAAGGYLFLGHSETLEGFEVQQLTAVHPTVYRKAP
jgi:chemotaxis protein methyltransferase CheR